MTLLFPNNNNKGNAVMLTDEQINIEFLKNHNYIRTAEIEKQNIKSGDYSLLNSCRIAYIYHMDTSTYGNLIEKRVKLQFGLNNKPLNSFGDAELNGSGVEIKTSFSSNEQGVFGLRQIRFGKNIKYYALVNYDKGNRKNLNSLTLVDFDDSINSIDSLSMFCVPANVMKSLIVKYGTYTHGTVNDNGPITEDTINANNYEYSLTYSKYAPSTSNTGNIWSFLQKFKIDYDDVNSLGSLIK